MNAVFETRIVVNVPGMDSRMGVGAILSLMPNLASSVIWSRYLPVTAALLVALSMSCAHGAHITMATHFSVTQAADGPVLAVTVQNRGNMPAQAVQLEVSVEGDSLVGPVLDKLAVDESTSVEFVLADHFQVPGRYPFVIRAFYKDAAGHRFTALTVGFYNHQTAVRPDIFIEGQTATVPVDGSGRVAFVLRNKGAGARMLDLELLLPEELSATRRHAVVEVDAKAGNTAVFDLENYSALPDSQYPVTLVGRYEHDGHSYGVAGTATIQLVNDSPLQIKPTWIWYVLAGLLPLVMVPLQWHARRVRSQRP